MSKKLYRYESAYPSEWNSAGIRLKIYHVFRESENSYWIRDNSLYPSKRDFRIVSKTSKKRFAYPTTEEALENYKARTERYLMTLKYYAQNVERCLSLVDRLDTTNNMGIFESEIDDAMPFINE